MLLTAVMGGFCPVNTWRCVLFSKIRLGEMYCDFAYSQADSDGAYWVFIEIERADAQLFTRAGDPTRTLSHALRQTLEWQSWLRDHADFARHQLRRLQRRRGLCTASERFWRAPQFMIVIGRRGQLNERTNRLRVELCNACPRLQIITYDRLIDPFGIRMELGIEGDFENANMVDDFVDPSAQPGSCRPRSRRAGRR